MPRRRIRRVRARARAPRATVQHAELGRQLVAVMEVLHMVDGDKAIHRLTKLVPLDDLPRLVELVRKAGAGKLARTIETSPRYHALTLPTVLRKKWGL